VNHKFSVIIPAEYKTLSGEYDFSSHRPTVCLSVYNVYSRFIVLKNDRKREYGSSSDSKLSFLTSTAAVRNVVAVTTAAQCGADSSGWFSAGLKAADGTHPHTHTHTRTPLAAPGYQTPYRPHYSLDLKSIRHGFKEA
jgi:hypothetical protein